MANTNPISRLLTKLHQTSKPLGQATSLVVTGGAVTLNSLLVGIPLWGTGLVKTLSGNPTADKAVMKITDYWIHVNNTLISHILPKIDMRITLPDDISTQGQYVLISNHQSWVDTALTQYVSENRLPLTRFFTKFELIYIPVVGQAFYFLDFPMMKRYSKTQIAKNPDLKNRDFIEAKRACEALVDKPFTLLNYVEGTRFSPKKHSLQQSSYVGLLKPKAGGIALALGALGEKIDGVLDMTIVYPDGIPDYNDLWKGNISRIGVDVRHVSLPADLQARLLAGRYQDDEQTREDMYDWLDKLWQQKQQIMAKMIADFENHPKRHSDTLC